MYLIVGIAINDNAIKIGQTSEGKLPHVIHVYASKEVFKSNGTI